MFLETAPTFRVSNLLETEVQQIIFAAVKGLILLEPQSRFWGQFGTNYLEIDWRVPKTGLEF